MRFAVMRSMLLMALALLLSFPALALDAPLRIGVSFSIPPWVMRHNDRGIELDLLREAFAVEGHQVEPIYLAFARVYDAFDSGELDGVVNARPGATQRGFYSQPVVLFHNYAISLKKKGFPEDIKIDFMRDKHVVGFQNASRLLGDEFKAMAAQSQNYSEIAKQSVQINLLFVREVDFIVMDRSIFGYYWQQALASGSRHSSSYRQSVTFHPVFEETPYSFVFIEREIRDAFDRGMKSLRDSGRYQEIIGEYDALKDLYGSGFHAEN